MIRKRRWLWVVLFIFGVTILSTLFTGWNVVIVRDYHRMLILAKSVSARDHQKIGMGPWPIILLGSLGFIAALATWALFFVKVLREMKLNQLQAEFLATVSHELKTPIASIELSSSLLRSGGLTPGESEQLWASHQMELRRLRTEVETILEATRWQAHPARMEPEVTDLESWLETSLQRWQSILGSKAILIREGDPLPRQIPMDLRSLNLITDNIIDNARKFSCDAPKVTIRTRRVPSQGLFSRPRWRIAIKDEGWGFDPNEARRIFRRFTRASHSAPYSIPGTGLGLYLAHTASRALGLKLTGYSPGKGLGAVFVLEGKERNAGTQNSQVQPTSQEAS